MSASRLDAPLLRRSGGGGGEADGGGEFHSTVAFASPPPPRFARSPSPAPLRDTGEDLHIAGYASLWWAPDGGRDVVAAGAFGESLARRPSPPMLHGHDPGRPVGWWDAFEEDARGLHARGRIHGDTAAGRLAQALHRAGRLDGLSIGFRTRRARQDRSGPYRVLSAVDLVEVSLTPHPLLPGARFAPVGPPQP